MERFRPSTSAEVIKQQTLQRQELQAKANGGWDSRKGESPQFTLPGGKGSKISEQGAIVRNAMPPELRANLENALVKKNAREKLTDKYADAYRMYENYTHRAKQLEEAGKKVTVDNILNYVDPQKAAAGEYARSQMSSAQLAYLDGYWENKKSPTQEQRSAYWVYKRHRKQFNARAGNTSQQLDAAGTSSVHGDLTLEQQAEQWAWKQLEERSHGFSSDQSAFQDYKQIFLEANQQESSDDESEHMAETNAGGYPTTSQLRRR